MILNLCNCEELFGCASIKSSSPLEQIEGRYMLLTTSTISTDILVLLFYAVVVFIYTESCMLIVHRIRPPCHVLVMQKERLKAGCTISNCWHFVYKVITVHIRC